MELTPHEVAELVGRGGARLVDVREAYEYEAGHIAASRHIPLERLGDAAGEIDGPVVFYCRVGARSAMAADAFERAGFEAHNLAGGLVAWDRDGLPLEPAGGHVAEH